MSLSRTCFLLCDIQSRFRSLIWGFPEVVAVAATLTKAARILDAPVICTEQYPKVFGSTVDELLPLIRDAAGASLPNTAVLPKLQFSMLTSEVQAEIDRLAPECEDFVLFGIEAHVCVQQTCLALLKRGKRVMLPVDGVSSQRPLDREVALRLLLAKGAEITTTESLLFTLVGTAEHPRFKPISKLVIEHNAMIARMVEAGEARLALPSLR